MKKWATHEFMPSADAASLCATCRQTLGKDHHRSLADRVASSEVDRKRLVARLAAERTDDGSALIAYALLLVMPVVFIAALVGSAASLVGGA